MGGGQAHAGSRCTAQLAAILAAGRHGIWELCCSLSPSCSPERSVHAEHSQRPQTGQCRMRLAGCNRDDPDESMRRRREGGASLQPFASVLRGSRPSVALLIRPCLRVGFFIWPSSVLHVTWADTLFLRARVRLLSSRDRPPHDRYHDVYCPTVLARKRPKG